MMCIVESIKYFHTAAGNCYSQVCSSDDMIQCHESRCVSKVSFSSEFDIHILVKSQYMMSDLNSKALIGLYLFCFGIHREITLGYRLLWNTVDHITMYFSDFIEPDDNSLRRLQRSTGYSSYNVYD